MRLQIFGDPTQLIHIQYPQEKDLESWPLNKKIKLSGISWRSNNSLSAIQFKFTNGVCTPMFQKDAVSQIEASGFWAVKETQVDASKDISRVVVKVHKQTAQLCSMSFEDESGATIKELKWLNSSDTELQYRDIPAGMQIIGLYMSKAGDLEWV